MGKLVRYADTYTDLALRHPAAWGRDSIKFCSVRTYTSFKQSTGMPRGW